MKVVVAGLGLMGQAYVDRLSSQGFNVLPYARRSGVAGEVAKRINSRPATLEDMKHRDTVLVVAGWDDDYLLWLAELVKDGESIVVNTSTVSPQASMKAGEIVGRERYVEAPVAAGPRVARDGKLPVIVAYWNSEAWNKARPVVEALAATIIEAGEPPSAMVVKLAFNNILFTLVAGIADSFKLLAAWKVDKELLKKLMESTWMRILIERYWDRAWGKAKTHFRLAGAVKDLALFIEAARRRGAPVPASAGALNEYLDALLECDENVDYTSVIRCTYERVARNAREIR